MDFVYFVVDVGVEEDLFGCCGFVGVDVGDDVDVVIKFDGSGVSYDLFFGCCFG